MLTLFACPKPFVDPHIAMIQRNAIRSWTRLGPGVEIILFGDEPGTGDICRELALKHVPAIEVNDRGTPFLSDIFRQANEIAKNPLVCYINADIILFPGDFLPAIRDVAKTLPSFLVAGQRWGISLNSPLNFDAANWDSMLRSEVAAFNDPHGPQAIDYFLSPKGLLCEMPPFLIGRPGWDPWFIENALSKRIPVVDVSERVMVVHQAHHYNHAGGLEVYRSGPEAEHNQSWTGSESYRCNLNYATHRLTEHGVKRAFGRRFKAHVRHFLWDWGVNKTGTLRRRLGMTRGPRKKSSDPVAEGRTSKTAAG